MYRVSPEQSKALGSGSAKALKDHTKSSATDGKMQQWFVKVLQVIIYILWLSL